MDTSTSTSSSATAPTTASAHGALGLFPNPTPAPKADLLQPLLNKSRNEGTADPADMDAKLTSTSAQQQQQNPTSNTSGLFGSSNTQQQGQPQASGGLFGTANTQQQSQPQQTGGLFGSTNTQQPNTNTGGGSLFGGLGGNANTQQNNTQSTGGGLFGGLGNNANTQQNNTQTSGLFGSNAQQSQPQTQGGLFGSGTNTGGGMFGGTGGLGSQNSANNMFSQQSNRPTTNSLFPQAQRPAATQQSQQQAPSLLGAAQHAHLNQSTPFGRLSMGQGAAAPNNTVSANSIDYSNLRPTTRFEDCIESVRQELEAVDKMIRQQEAWAKQIEAFTAKHEDDVNSVAPDVAYIKEKAEDVEQALAQDAYGVEAQRKHAEKDYQDVERCQRIVTNLALPQSYRYPSMSMSGFGGMYGSQQRPQQAPSNNEGGDAEYDTDLVSNYFIPMATELQQTMANYSNNLAEIESHMRVIEGSAVAQAQQLAQRRTGVTGNNPQSSDGTVRELADTLRGFEQSILGVAGVVGECREGVNELVLGRLGGQLGGGMR